MSRPICNGVIAKIEKNDRTLLTPVDKFLCRLILWSGKPAIEAAIDRAICLDDPAQEPLEKDADSFAKVAGEEIKKDGLMKLPPQARFFPGNLARLVTVA